VKEKLNNYLEENKIRIDKNGNFEMYVVVDADDEDHEIGSMFHGGTTEVYGKDRAFEDLKENNSDGITLNSGSSYKIEKKTSIREDLLAMKNKMFKVLVNKESIVDIKADIVYVNKYKVIEKIKLNPILKFKIKSISDENISILLYNNITNKSKTIDIKRLTYISKVEDIKMLVNEYLTKNEQEVYLMNSIADDGMEL
jgi:hypothetical protein